MIGTRIFRILTANLALVAVLAATPPVAGADDAHPLRGFYPSVQTISTEQLRADYTAAVVVDARSGFEHSVMRINKAVNLPLDENFLAGLSRLRGRDGSAPLVFYGNDPADARSYRAALEALSAGWANVYAYDDGVFALHQTDPQLAVMPGTPHAREEAMRPIGVHGRWVDFEEFKKRSRGPNALVLDIRDVYHKDVEPRLEPITHVSLEALLAAVDNRIWTEKTLLIFDADGSQSRWLQLFLQANGYLDFTFLDGGTDGLVPGKQTTPAKEDIGSTTVSQQWIRTLVNDPSLTGADRRLLLHLLGALGRDNLARVELAEAQRLTGPDGLSPAMTRLSEGSYLLASVFEGYLVCRINPKLAFRGPMAGDHWVRLVMQFDKAVAK